MEEEGVPSTTLREVSLLLMLSESNHVVKWVSVSDYVPVLFRSCLSPCMCFESTPGQGD